MAICLPTYAPTDEWLRTAFQPKTFLEAQEGVWGYTFSVPMWILGEPDVDLFLEQRIAEAKHAVTEKVVDAIFGSDRPAVIRVHVEQWPDESCHEVCFTIHCRLAYVQIDNVHMVVYDEPFVFTNHNGQKEWKCPACGMVNIMAATYCGEKHEHAVGCGRPRDHVH